jgi:3-oxoacyl-[acyl-carrier-protein] synthase-3
LTLFLHGLGHAHPDHEITNRFLTELDIGTDDEWILERVGIHARRSVLPLDYIRRTRNRDPRVIAGSSAGDSHSCPAEACHVARALGLEVPAFDVSSACTSFYVQLHWLSLMQPERLPDYVLIVAPETLTTTVDYDDRATAVLWGDGAAAAVVSTRHASGVRVLGTTVESRPEAATTVLIPRGGHFEQDGRTVQMFGIRRMVRSVELLRERYERDGRRFHFVGHQANLRMLERVREQCGIPGERHHTNVEWYGNTGAASAASVISMQWEKWGSHDDVAVAGVGAGLTWASYLLRFGEAA